MCVQRFDDSLDPAIRITFRVSRRSSSLWEPRDPSLKDSCRLLCFSFQTQGRFFIVCGAKMVVKTGDRPAVFDQQRTPRLPLVRAGPRARNRADIKANKSNSRIRGCVCFVGCVNDPSAGSPTETLLRLLLPRNVQI